MYGGLQYTPQLQASFQLQWLAVIMVRISGGHKGQWWRPCMGFHVGDKWFATSSVCFLGMDERGKLHDTIIASWLVSPAYLIYVASGFYTLNTSNPHIFATNNMYEVHKFHVMQEYKEFRKYLNGNFVMFSVGRHPYGITNAPLSTKKFNIEEMNEEDCYMIGYDDQKDTNIFPKFQPSVRVLNLKGMLNDCSSSRNSPPKYTSKDRFGFCAQTTGDVGVCIHDVGAPVVCNNVVQGMLYRVGAPDCPMNGRGWRNKLRGGAIFENEFPHLPKNPLSDSDSANGFLDISLYKESFEKYLRNEDNEDFKDEDKYVLYKAKEWSDAPISAEMTLATRPFPDWEMSTLVFEEWPITMETTTLPDDYYYEDNANPKQKIVQLEGEEAVDDEYSDDQMGEDMKCQYSHSHTLQHAMEIWPILLINLLIL
ncbi:uncharacterized protein LOC120351234 [Nilaparvata lugens]|uniref:uncharacterized protein LOC120351234 n=1 Tax=Nilaparvata lugens TaxID=108931 RepID=UPI00193EB2A5|nr:uncharacterized protein LOC120351234 [Nilaparvata lugens]